MKGQPTSWLVCLIGPGSVQKSAVMERAASPLQFDMDFASDVNLLVSHLHVSPVTDLPGLVMVENRSAMASSNECEATVFDGHLVQSNPAGHELCWFDREIGRILMPRLLDAAGRLHEALAAVELDVRSNQGFDNVENSRFRGACHKNLIVCSALIDLADRRLRLDSVCTWFEFDE